ncbi:hypothetical protein E2C01_037529 [Portunus trituberculatus]|uniref:Uncharacterized protein n=1 Tax=Portunus trituberculatus TaxID=210409 RepID=A0A5B7FEC0_PORTR|nr:hypothetical protein [Portunus trituberculatus]
MGSFVRHGTMPPREHPPFSHILIHAHKFYPTISKDDLKPVRCLVSGGGKSMWVFRDEVKKR